MPIPIGEMGASAVSGAAILAFLMKVVPVLAKKMNGKNGNGKPGQTKICIENVKKIVEHDTTIKHLCAVNVEIKENMAEAREENRGDHKQIFDKLDDLRS